MKKGNGEWTTTGTQWLRAGVAGPGHHSHGMAVSRLPFLPCPPQHGYSTKPPSMVMLAPVTKPASGLAM